MKRLDYYFESVAGLGTLFQPDYVLRVISMVLTCLSVAISLAFTIYKWIKEVKKKGEITGEDVSKLIGTIEEHKDKINKGGDNQ